MLYDMLKAVFIPDPLWALGELRKKIVKEPFNVYLWARLPLAYHQTRLFAVYHPEGVNSFR